MDAFFDILRVIGLVAAVIMLFNIAIFVHELGHFLAARWRGVYVDRFQVWFGKPIWKKKVGEVQYGLGWLPAGGFVSLPQMVTMESVEGKAEGANGLPEIKPIDKIIVAVAGPLFSLLLAVVFAFVVWGIGKPVDKIESTEIGYVVEGQPAALAGIKVGDVVTAIDGNPIDSFVGNLRSGLVENIRLSEHEKITLTVERDGQTMDFLTEFFIPDTKWWQRSELRRIGVGPRDYPTVERTIENGPAADAKLQPGDLILSIDGTPIRSYAAVTDKIGASEGKSQQWLIERDGEQMTLNVTPEIAPSHPKEGYKVGIAWAPSEIINETIVHPTPLQSMVDSVDMMYITLSKVLAPGSSVKPEHLQGPVGIAKSKYEMLLTENGWRRVLWFMVFFNINLAILNMLPIPILDGGHITMALYEVLRGKPLNPAILSWVQTAFALLLLSFMLFLTSKDIGSFFNPTAEPEQKELRFE